MMPQGERVVKPKADVDQEEEGWTLIRATEQKSCQLFTH